MGTPWYMSPEQIQGEKLDHRSDQYSFGVTCFHMFAGRPPFPGKNAVSVAVQHLKEEPPALASLRADLPQAMCDVIHRMLAKNASGRFATEADLEAALQKLQRVPVNSSLLRRSRWTARIREWFPQFRYLLPILAAVAAGSFLRAQQLHPHISLPPTIVQPSVSKENSAARQFAFALLNAHNKDAWKAVIDHFPETREAEMAQARLGLHNVMSPIPNYTTALDEFEKLVAAGNVPEKQHLKVIGRIGQAYTLSQQVADERTRGKSEAELLKLQDLAEAMLTAAYDTYTGPNRDVDMEFAIAQAPQELRDFMRAGNRLGYVRPFPPRD
jgi:eukaryotic-like serine/threonine-protein kinase